MQTSHEGTILLVDDETAVRGLVARMLRTDGYDVLEATCGQAAIAAAATQSTPISLIVSDVNMPDMNGREVVRAIRERFPAMRALLISGGVTKAEATTGLDDAPTAFLAKPFSLADLVIAVRTVLRAGVADRGAAA